MDDRNNKLITVDDQAAMMDLLRRDYGYGRGGAHESEETHLRDYWRVIRRRLWVPIVVTILVTTLTTIYNLRLPSIYEGVSKIEVGHEDRVVNLKDVQLNLGGEDAQYFNTQLKILVSPKVAYLVVKALDLEHNTSFFPAAKSGKQPASQLEITSGADDEKADMQRPQVQGLVDTLIGNVEVKQVRDTRLVEIHYRHQDRELARKVADTWADVFKGYNLQSMYDANKQSATFLEKSIADYQIKLRSSEEKLQNYRRANPILDFGDSKNVTGERLAALNQLLLTAETERKSLQNTYELSRSIGDPSTLPEIQRDQGVQEVARRLTDLRQKRQQLLVEFTEEWPEVQKVNQEIQQLEGEQRAVYSRILSTIENQYKVALQKEKQLRESFTAQRSETLQQSDASITAKMLQTEIDTNRTMLTNLLNSQSAVQVSAAGAIKSNINVREYSPLPRTPVRPNRLQNILIALALSLLGGVALVLFLDYINNKMESVEDIDRYMKLPALGVIPVFEPDKQPRKALSNGLDDATSLVPSDQLAGNGSVILTQVEANSSIAESYRQLRTSLLLSSAGHAPRTLLVTSSQPAEGKTTTSVNTAISLAQTGSAVLIVDADLRRPRVHKIFGLKNNAGLCNYLAGDCDLASLIQIALPNLYVLPVGPLPPNPAELLGSVKMKNVVETLAANFDYVVIDSPPVSSFADSLILSALVEGVIIVVRSGFTPREMAQRTKAHLQSVGAKILGVVINQIKLQPHDYYYYSTYYSRYYYSGGDQKEPDQAAD